MSAAEDVDAMPLDELVGHLANVLGTSEEAVLGLPIALALRWLHEDGRFFLSGVPADLTERVCGAFGARTSTGSADHVTGVYYVEEAWFGASPRIGTGPVGSRYDFAGAQRIVITPGDGEQGTKLERAQRLREHLRVTSEALGVQCGTPPDVAELIAALRTQSGPLARVLTDVACSRRLVGRYLLDAGDIYDDERIDQLGDGYVRASKLWTALAKKPDANVVHDVLALEQLCAQWMRGAAEPPTRYAF